MLPRIVLLLMLAGDVLAQSSSFRSILIKRACRKRPELDFCNESPEEEPQPVRPAVLEALPFPAIAKATSTESPTSPPPIDLIKPPDNIDIKTPAMATLKPAADKENVTAEEKIVVKSEKTEIKASSGEKETLGSLVRLPKPAVVTAEEVKIEKILAQKMDGEKAEKEVVEETNTTSTVHLEDAKGVLVFVSEYCVIERENFVKNCSGEIEKSEIAFCKTYPSACVSTAGVLPIMSYCQRYYKQYPKLCTKQLVGHDALQFCYAFEHFCLPELHAASQPTRATVAPKSTLRKCEDVLPEARQVCNPFPNPRDTFNVLRCTQFFTNCKRFIDWA
ncbi:unnamed protein product [Caenorhabditis auriculariae]|uniref:DUF19 domain-containing protein n=1 Tax=Caenorhabditis auriculariae TaxID=2777116 RepID=A0A8S1HS95_9PELO|nr:unnamed protein product [Caenorhabditis auriculariae]